MASQLLIDGIPVSNQGDATVTTDRAAERRAADRERLAASLQQLWSSEGWKRWAKARRMFRSYSFANTLLIAMQCPEATYVAGFRTFEKLGRKVRRGERALRIVAPRTFYAEREQEDGTTKREKRIYFVHVPVFDISQTEGEPLVSPIGDIEGDSHGDHIENLVRYAAELGYSVDFRPVAGNCGGWCAYESKQIVIDSTGSVNEQLATLAHELAHAMGASTKAHGREHAEVIAEAAAHLALAGLGVDISERSTGYLAGWAEKLGIDALRDNAKVIDELARRIEKAAMVPTRDLVAA
jgi:antirestriction protein ArdC